MDIKTYIHNKHIQLLVIATLTFLLLSPVQSIPPDIYIYIYNIMEVARKEYACISEMKRIVYGPIMASRSFEYLPFLCQIKKAKLEH